MSKSIPLDERIVILKMTGRQALLLREACKVYIGDRQPPLDLPGCRRLNISEVRQLAVHLLELVGGEVIGVLFGGEPEDPNQ